MDPVALRPRYAYIASFAPALSGCQYALFKNVRSPTMGNFARIVDRYLDAGRSCRPEAMKVPVKVRTNHLRRWNRKKNTSERHFASLSTIPIY